MSEFRFSYEHFYMDYNSTPPWLSIHLYCTFIRPSIHPTPSIHFLPYHIQYLSIHPSKHPSVCLSNHPSIHLLPQHLQYPSITPPYTVSVHPSICSSVHPSIYLLPHHIQYLSTHQITQQSIYSFTHQCLTYLVFYPSNYLFSPLFTCLSIKSPNNPSVYTSLHSSHHPCIPSSIQPLISLYLSTHLSFHPSILCFYTFSNQCPFHSITHPLFTGFLLLSIQSLFFLAWVYP